MCARRTARRTRCIDASPRVYSAARGAVRGGRIRVSETGCGRPVRGSFEIFRGILRVFHTAARRGYHLFWAQVFMFWLVCG